MEAGENDRLYILTLYPDDGVEILILRFGKRFRPERYYQSRFSTPLIAPAINRIAACRDR